MTPQYRPPRYDAPMCDAPSFFPFHFLHDPHDTTRPPRGLTTRDGVAMGEMWSALAQLGYRMGDQHLNYPGPRERDADGLDIAPNPNRLHKVPIAAGPGDLVLTVTRVVTHHETEKHEKRGSRLAGTDLEYKLADCWRPYFQLLTRTTAWLSEDLKDLLLDGCENRQHILFRQFLRNDDDANESEASHYMKLSYKAYRGHPSTAAFVLRLPEIEKGGPGYLGIFGMTGSTTAAWARLLRTRLLDLLREPAFVVAELSTSHIPERTSNLHFAESWDARVILHHRL